MKKIIIPAELSEVDKIRNLLREEVQDFCLSEEDFFKLELAVVEACVNIICYAYPGVRGEIDFEIQKNGRRVSMTIIDSGIAFNPCVAPKPDLERIVEAGQRGGLGIFLVRELMDDVDYRREAERNILTLAKRF